MSDLHSRVALERIDHGVLRSNDLFVRLLLRKHGIDANSVVYIPVGFGTTRLATLQAGTVDAVPLGAAISRSVAAGDGGDGKSDLLFHSGDAGDFPMTSRPKILRRRAGNLFISMTGATRKFNCESAGRGQSRNDWQP